MRKNKIDWRLRYGLLMLFVAISIGAAISLSKVVKPIIEEKQKTLYSYQIDKGVDYSVVVKETGLYQDVHLESDRIYLNKLVNQIPVQIAYNFQGSEVTNLVIQYKMTGLIQGYKLEDKQYQTIWQQDFDYKVPVSIDKEGESFTIEEELVIPYGIYSDYVDMLFKSAEISTESRFIFNFVITLNGETEYGLIKDVSELGIVIPFGKTMFTIDKIGEERVEDSLDETYKIVIPPDKGQIYIRVSILVLLGIASILLLTLTKGISKDTLYDKELKKVFSQYGNRMVGINHPVKYNQNLTIYQVKTIDDLIRVADEHGKPVLYQSLEKTEETDEFYVLDNQEVYIFNVGKRVEEIRLRKRSKDIAKTEEG